jgi:dihydroorotate dehydrogenase
VQLYTALVYKGPGLFRRIRDDLAARLAADGLTRIEDAVGLDADRLADG